MSVKSRARANIDTLEEWLALGRRSSAAAASSSDELIRRWPQRAQSSSRGRLAASPIADRQCALKCAFRRHLLSSLELRSRRDAGRQTARSPVALVQFFLWPRSARSLRSFLRCAALRVWSAQSAASLRLPTFLNAKQWREREKNEWNDFVRPAAAATLREDADDEWDSGRPAKWSAARPPEAAQETFERDQISDGYGRRSRSRSRPSMCPARDVTQQVGGIMPALTQPAAGGFSRLEPRPSSFDFRRSIFAIENRAPPPRHSECRC